MKILFAGESWITTHTHTKGFDQFTHTTYHEGAEYLLSLLRKDGIVIDYLPNHLASSRFPFTMEEISQYDAVVLSDIGANTLLLSPDTFDSFQRTTNRCALIADYVRNGGGLCMIGGYLTFQGIEGKGAWKRSHVADVLPAVMLDGDDRVETPEGVVPTVVSTEHSIVDGISNDWPPFLGYNQLADRPDSDVIVRAGNDVFLSAGQFGAGRSVVFASDCSPHWGSPEFMSWPDYGKLWKQILEWLSGER